jgi:O-antigen/teichoic acid export membrane protein
MLKITKRQIIHNVASSWFALAVNVVIGVFLSPFILHRLGDAAFGIWILIFSVTGYYGLFDLGIRSSVVRFVSKYSATKDFPGLTKVINTGVFAYAAVGAVTVLLTLVGAVYVDRLFKIPAEFHSTARWLFIIVGTSVAVGFPLGVFGGALEGLQRFYLINGMSVVSTLVRAGAIVLALNHGCGLVTLALITTGLPFLTSLIRSWVALRILRTPISPRYVNRETARFMANHSGLTFVIMMSSQLRFQSDELVIGTLLSASAITFFSIGARVADYASNLVLGVSQMFVPMASHSEAQGDAQGLRRIMIAGNRACAFVIFPLCATLIILGKSLIEVWVGARYVPQSYPVLLVLIIPMTFQLAQAASTRMLAGIGQHRTLGIVTVVEGVVNVILSILLVRPYGVFGDAVGTAIPLSCTVLFFLPRHACRKFGVDLATFLRQAYALPLRITAPLVLTLLLERRWFVAHRMAPLGGQILIAWAVYGLCFFRIYKNKRAFAVESEALVGTEMVPSIGS